MIEPLKEFLKKSLGIIKKNAGQIIEVIRGIFSTKKVDDGISERIHGGFFKVNHKEIPAEIYGWFSRVIFEETSNVISKIAGLVMQCPVGSIPTGSFVSCSLPREPLTVDPLLWSLLQWIRIIGNSNWTIKLLAEFLD